MRGAFINLTGSAQGSLRSSSRLERSSTPFKTFYAISIFLMAVTDLFFLAMTALSLASRVEANLLVRGINEAGSNLIFLAGGKTVVSIPSGSSSEYNRLYNDSAVVRFKAS